MGNDAAERTENATARRRQKERDRGNVAKSKDMEAALVMVGGVALLFVFAKYMYSNMLNMLRETFSNLKPDSIDTSDIIGILLPYFKYLAYITVPFFVCLFIYAIFAIVLCLWVSKKPIPKNIVLQLVINGVFNILWCLTFFTLNLTFLGNVTIVLLLIMAYVLIISINKYEKTYSYFTAIYPIWVSIATTLNMALWILN